MFCLFARPHWQRHPIITRTITNNGWGGRVCHGKNVFKRLSNDNGKHLDGRSLYMRTAYTYLSWALKLAQTQSICWEPEKERNKLFLRLNNGGWYGYICWVHLRSWSHTYTAYKPPLLSAFLLAKLISEIFKKIFNKNWHLLEYNEATDTVLPTHHIIIWISSTKRARERVEHLSLSLFPREM